LLTDARDKPTEVVMFRKAERTSFGSCAWEDSNPRPSLSLN